MATKDQQPLNTGTNDELGSDTRPHPLTRKEWSELLAMPEVREGWGLGEDETPESFAARVYAAKFHFHSGGPGYDGDLYIVQGDALTGDPPLMFTREDGKLVLLKY